MKISPASLFANMPAHLPEELCQTLFENPAIRIERILSQGQHSAENTWYDQEQSEWVLLLQGKAKLSFADAEPVELNPGDYLLLPAHCKHRVESTTSNPTCIWLAVHVKDRCPSDSLSAGD